MDKNAITDLVKRQKKFFDTNATREINFRIKMLKSLKSAIIANKESIIDATRKDFGVEGHYDAVGRILFVIDELNYFIRNLRKWSKPEKVKTSMLVQPAKSIVVHEPMGNVLLIGPWNAPYMVNLFTLIASIGAGNCTILKPSEFTSASSKVLSRIISSVFERDFCAVVEGGIDESTRLLQQRFDLICYTGGTRVGKIVYEAASKNLTPVILELGGKSPCIIDESAHIQLSAKRICTAKHMNGGQVCTSPDYLLVHSEIKQKFISEMKKRLELFYPDTVFETKDYTCIVNNSHFDRLHRLLGGVNKNNIEYGGKSDRTRLKIEPTLINNVKWDDEIMQEEIFGPLIPVIEYTDLDSVIGKINSREKPLALYIYSRNKKNIRKVMQETTSGSMGVNGSILQYFNKYLPFGGVGHSGFGRYRGKSGFESFSNKKSVFNKSLYFESDLLDPPYKNKHKVMDLMIR